MKQITALLATVAAALACVVLSATPALAHVLLDSAQPNGDGSVRLTFSFDHGCDNSPTNGLELTVPQGSSILSVEQPEGWKGDVDADRTSVTWDGPGIAPGEAARFVVEARLTGQVGSALLFPTIQTCEDGEGYEWVEDSESAERPSPRLIATTAVLDQQAGTPVSQPKETGAMAIVSALALFATVAVGATLIVNRRRAT